MLIHSEPAGGVKAIRIFLAVCFAIAMAGMIVAIAAAPDVLGLWLSLATIPITEVLVWLIIPTRFEVYPERLRIVFPTFGWDIAFDSIESVRATNWWEPFAFSGIRFGTSPGSSVAVLRKSPRLIGRPSLVISPKDRELFLSKLNAAMASNRK